MIDKPAAAAAPSSFSPLARAVIDSVGEGIVVFDSQGRVLYANAAARRVVDGQNGDVRNRLQKLGARKEGTLKDAFWMQDRFVDQYLWAILGSEWRNVRSRPRVH